MYAYVCYEIIVCCLWQLAVWHYPTPFVCCNIRVWVVHTSMYVHVAWTQGICRWRSWSWFSCYGVRENVAGGVEVCIHLVQHHTGRKVVHGVPIQLSSAPKALLVSTTFSFLCHGIHTYEQPTYRYIRIGTSYIGAPFLGLVTAVSPSLLLLLRSWTPRCPQ